MIQETHLGLIIQGENQLLTNVMYFKSKFNRNIGDFVTYEGKKYKVYYIGTSRNNVITFLNTLIKGQNKLVRKFGHVL